MSERTIEQKCRQAAADLDRIRAGRAPTDEDLKDAPTLQNWRIVAIPLPEREALTLEGVVTGHPLLRSGPATTSMVIALDPNRQWARTLSRWYSLGEPEPGQFII